MSEAKAQESHSGGATDPIPQHISTVEVWGGPDRNYYIFIALSFLFGFFGLDHFYLRSYETGFKKFIVNTFGLGMWYFWDIIQILADGQKVRKEGLSSPLDWIRGIGYGVFTVPSFTKSKNAKPQTGGFTAEKDYVIYTFLAVFLGFLGADKFYLGQGFQGLAKLISCFNIFLFLFGWMWVLWDGFHAFFMTQSVLDHGVSAPLPYSFLFNKTVPGDVFKVKPTGTSNGTTGAQGGFVNWVVSLFPLPPVPSFPVKEAYSQVAAPLLTVPVVKSLQALGPHTPTAPGMPSTPAMPTVPSAPGMPPMPAMPTVPTAPGMPAMPTVPTAHGMPAMPTVPTAPGMPAMPTVPTVPTAPGMPAMPTVPTAPAMPTVPTAPGMPTVPSATPLAPEAEQKMAFAPMHAQKHAQTGGGVMSSHGPGPVIAGALTAVVIAGGLKGFYDIISAQYG